MTIPLLIALARAGLADLLESLDAEPQPRRSPLQHRCIAALRRAQRRLGAGLA